jgi:hypothetical protein
MLECYFILSTMYAYHSIILMELIHVHVLWFKHKLKNVAFLTVYRASTRQQIANCTNLLGKIKPEGAVASEFELLSNS